MRMYWSEKILCIKCNGDGNLLVCSENECPLAIHKECMGCPGRFDDVGRFYCPYCWYKQAIAESRRAREYALSRKKALLIFMDEEVIPTSKHLIKDTGDEDNGCARLDTSVGNANVMKCDGAKSRENGDVLKQPMHHDEEHKTGGAEEETTQEDESEAFEGQNLISEVHQEENTGKAEEINIQEDDPSQISNAGEKMIQEDPSHVAHEDKQEEEEDSLQVVYETLSASAGDGPSKSVPPGVKRGLKRKGSTVTGSKAIKSEVKKAKRSDKRNKKSLTVTPARRSSRRLSSTPVNVKMSK